MPYNKLKFQIALLCEYRRDVHLERVEGLKQVKSPVHLCSLKKNKTLSCVGFRTVLVFIS